MGASLLALAKSIYYSYMRNALWKFYENFSVFGQIENL